MKRPRDWRDWLSWSIIITALLLIGTCQTPIPL
jgi:hypothetical protein